MHAALKLQCGRVTGNKKFTIGGLNVFRHNSFVNPTRLPLLCRNSRAVALAEPGLTAGWLIDEEKFQIFKIRYRSNFILLAAFNTVTALLEQQECISVGIFSKSLF